MKAEGNAQEILSLKYVNSGNMHNTIKGNVRQ